MLRRKWFLIPVFLALFLVVQGSGNFRDGVVFSDTWTCPELLTDYSDWCKSQYRDCNGFCFYPVCYDCIADSHEHRYPCWRCVSDGQGGSFCFWTTCIRVDDVLDYDGVWGGCTEWDYFLYGDEVGEDRHRSPYRRADFQAPNLHEALEFGRWPAGFAGDRTVCDRTEQPGGDVVESGNQDLVHIGMLGSASYVTECVNGEGDPNYCQWIGTPAPLGIIGGQYGVTEFQESSDLALVSRDPDTGDPFVRESGSPYFSSLTKVSDNRVAIWASVAVSHTLQYRYWVYNGVVPSRHIVEYRSWLNSVTIPNARGVYAFQVRTVDADDVASGGSNIRYVMLGMDSYRALPSPSNSVLYDFPMRETPTPLPPTASGVTRPARPNVDSVEQVSGVAATVEVTMGGSYSVLQYRVWPYNGRIPSDLILPWRNAYLSVGKFRIYGLEVPHLIAPPGEGSNIPSDERRPMRVFSIQTRVYDSSNKIGSDASQVFNIRVWGGGVDWEW